MARDVEMSVGPAAGPSSPRSLPHVTKAANPIVSSSVRPAYAVRTSSRIWVAFINF